MSLGINALWRARPQRRLGLLIPRESLSILRPPHIRPAATSSLFSTRARLNLADTPKDLDHAGQGADEVRGQQDNASDPSDPPLARLVEVVGQSEEAKELRDWLSQEPRRERKKTKRPRTDLDELEQSLERSKLAKSVFVKPARTYPNKRESRESWRAHQESISTQVYFDRNVQNLLRQDIYVKPESTDWRHVLSLLSSATPEESAEWFEDGMKIELSERIYAAIMENGGDEKIGAIRRRTGASFKVLRAESPSNTSTLLVSGTRAAMKSATAEFRRIAGRITITRLRAPLAPDEAVTESFSDNDFFVPPLTREEGGPWHRFKVDYNAYTTPWPKHMSFRSFSQYVASLTDSVVYPHLNSPLYNPTKHAVLLDHERAVARRLKRAFLNYEARPWISCSALKLALSFLCRKGDKYLPEVRSIFVTMDRFGLRMDADVFNMMLRAPTTTRNLRKFRQTVILMTRKGFAPNLDTWILFLRMFESVEVKSLVLQAMNAKNLLGTPEAIRRVAEEMAPFDTEHAMSEGKNFTTFMQEQSDRYGPDWLTRDAANQVMDVLCRHGRFGDAFALLGAMRAHVDSIPPEFKADRVAALPDAVTFNTIISHARTQGKVPAAVNALRRMKTPTTPAQPDRVTFELLFDLAWRARLRHAVSVTWRFAALARLTTFRMRERVAGFLGGGVKKGSGCGGRGAAIEGVSAAAREALGGEALARDLVGGPRALERVRGLARGRHLSEVGSLAARCWPEAFCGYGPGVAFGYVLAQAVLRDLACRAAARKNGNKKSNNNNNNNNKDEEEGRASPAGDDDSMREYTFRPKAMPLLKRVRRWDYWAADLAPLEGEGPTGPIGPGDRWELEEAPGPGVRRRLETLEPPPSESPDESATPPGDELVQEEQEPTDDPSPPAAGGEASTDEHQREGLMAILDPDVWAAEGGEAIPPRHELQRRNEEDVLAALARLEERYYLGGGDGGERGPGKAVVAVPGDGDDDDGSLGWAAFDRAGDGVWGAEDDVEGEWRSIMGGGRGNAYHGDDKGVDDDHED